MAVSSHKQTRATRKVETRPGDELTCDRTTLDSESLDPESLQESYFGGKGGCFKHLVNQIPPHNRLIIPFAGHCAIVRHMKLPQRVMLNDLDASVFRWWRRYLEAATPIQEAKYFFNMETSQERRILVKNQCGLELLEDLAREVRIDDENHGLQRAFIYLDPPYHPSTLTSKSRYKHVLTNDDHLRLLAICKELPCRVMISGYSCKLYATELKQWRHFDFPSATHGGQRTEHVWCNYPEPTELQDYRYLGRDRRERFKLQRRETNIIKKLARLSELERNALLTAVDSHFGVSRSRK